MAKRTKLPGERQEGEIQFIKKGGGSFRTADGRIIKPNQKFFARLEDISEAFRDIIVPVNEESREKVRQSIAADEELFNETPLEFTAVESEKKGWWNVIDSSGKIMNENLLREAKAKSLVESLKSLSGGDEGVEDVE